MMYMQAGKNELKEYAKQTGLKIISGMEDTSQKCVLGVLSQRQNEMLDMLDFVKVKTQMPYDPSAGTQKNTIDQLIFHPIVTSVLGLGAIISSFFAVLSGQPTTVNPAMNRQWLYSLLFILLILGQAVFHLVRNAKAQAPGQPLPEAEAMLDVDAAKMQLEKRLVKLITDSEAICGMFQSQRLDGMNAYEDELVKLYSSLYEAKVDRPECEEFNYSLTMAEMMLRQIGLKTVAYSEEQKKLFNIEVEDYRDEMRVPAIIREKTGEVVKKGEYIQNRG